MKTSFMSVLSTVALADVYCPSVGDLVVAYGDGVQLQDGGWGIQGNGGAATKAAFNLNGGFVEFDFDVSRSNTGVIPNIYTVSPEGIGGGFSSDRYCDDGENDKPDCLEVDWIEANGGCGGATTLHTVSGTGPGACNYWGCRSSYSFGGSIFHMRVEYGNDGKFTITRDGQQISGDSLDPPASGNDWGIVKSTYDSRGAVIYSSQWTGSWVPADFCGSGPGDLDGSHFVISNLRVSGSVVQGPEPQKCSGPQPSPSPTPTPSPSPSGWQPCSGGICCDPHASPAQFCPGGEQCQDCGAGACQCPGSTPGPSPGPAPGCDCSWTQGGSQCGASDGSFCWGQCCAVCDCGWTAGGSQCGASDGSFCWGQCCAVCDCGWTAGGSQCGGSDGSICWGQCCGSHLELPANMTLMV